MGRQAAKNQRRTQPKPQRPQAKQRQRHFFREKVSAGQLEHHRATLANVTTGSGSASPAEDVFDALAGRRRPAVRARLCARLLQRSCVAMEAALERRHGDSWPQHVLKGDLATAQQMWRMCECLCLKPALEHQVLRTTQDRARELLQQRSAGHDAAIKNQVTVKTLQEIMKETAQMDCNGSSEDANGPSSTRTCSDSDQAASTLYSDDDEESFSGVTLSSSSELPSEDDWSGASGNTSMTETITGPGSQEPDDRVSLQASSGPQCKWKTAKETSKYKWKGRTSRALGLPEVHGTPAEQEMSAQGHFMNDEDEEESALSSKLAAAVRNAEIHAANAYVSKALLHDNMCSDVDTATPASSILSASGRTSSAGSFTSTSSRGSSSNSVRFSRKSEVSFFSCPHEAGSADAPGALAYHCSLQTKVFDGPSGHKAKRSPAAEQSATALVTECKENACLSEDDIAEWEDHCDDIAELMSQERSNLLWSMSW